MPEYRHPRALESVDGHPPAQVHISRAEKAEVSDGTFTTDDVSVVRAIATAFDVDVSTLRVDGDADSDAHSGETDTCETVKGDGEVCGRDLPCPYHSEDGGE